MAIMLTSKAHTTQVKSGLWKTCKNVLFMCDDGRIMYVPRNFLTDLITFVSCDFADVRAAIIHDVGCKYHQVIYTKLTLEELRGLGLLRNKKNEWICEDIPKKYLYIEDISFNKINKIFKQALQACYENTIKTNLMFFAVYLNIGWLKYPFKKIKIDKKKFYNEEW